MGRTRRTLLPDVRVTGANVGRTRDPGTREGYRTLASAVCKHLHAYARIGPNPHCYHQHVMQVVTCTPSRTRISTASGARHSPETRMDIGVGGHGVREYGPLPDLPVPENPTATHPGDDGATGPRGSREYASELPCLFAHFHISTCTSLLTSVLDMLR